MASRSKSQLAKDDTKKDGSEESVDTTNLFKYIPRRSGGEELLKIQTQPSDNQGREMSMTDNTDLVGILTVSQGINYDKVGKLPQKVIMKESLSAREMVGRPSSSLIEDKARKQSEDMILIDDGEEEFASVFAWG